MSDQPATLRDSLSSGAALGDGAATPGLLLVYAMGQPRCLPLPLGRGPLELGRGDGTGPLPADPKMSRRHTTLTYDGERFHITDHGSQNGTFVDGTRVDKSLSTASAQVVRTGDSVFLLCGDLRPFARVGVQQQGDLVVGPALAETFAQASRAAQFGQTLHITGESGSGKEGVARVFHAQSGINVNKSPGPFIAINCATIAPIDKSAAFVRTPSSLLRTDRKKGQGEEFHNVARL